MNLELFKGSVRPGLTVWSATMLSCLAFGLVVAELWLITIWAACIAQWIPDRAIRRIKESCLSKGES